MLAAIGDGMFNTAMLQVTSVKAFADNYIWLIHAPNDAQQVVAT